jgi:hypothetical protein
MSAPGAPAAQAGGDAGGEGEGALRGALQGDAHEGQHRPDVGALAQQLEQVASGQQELREFLTSQPWQQGDPAALQQQHSLEQQAPALGDVDLSFLDDLDDPDDDVGGDGDDPEAFADRVLGSTEQFAAAAVHEAVAPLAEGMQQALAQQDQRLEDMRLQTEFRQLAEEFPELEDGEAQQAVFEQAAVVAQAIGQPAAAGEPQFIRIIYMAAKAAEMAADEEGREYVDSAAHLEGGGGANPAGGTPNAGDAIVNTAKRGGHSVLPWH